MAAIDKIYGTLEQWMEFVSWIVYESKRPSLLKYLYYWHTFEKLQNVNDQKPISNFPSWQDKWLLLHCPLTFITDQIRDQYNLKPNEYLK